MGKTELPLERIVQVPLEQQDMNVGATRRFFLR